MKYVISKQLNYRAVREGSMMPIDPIVIFIISPSVLRLTNSSVGCLTDGISIIICEDLIHISYNCFNHDFLSHMRIEMVYTWFMNNSSRSAPIISNCFVLIIKICMLKFCDHGFLYNFRC